MVALIWWGGWPSTGISTATPQRLSPTPSTPVSPQATPVCITFPLWKLGWVSGKENPVWQPLKKKLLCLWESLLPDRCGWLLLALGCPAWGPDLSSFWGNPPYPWAYLPRSWAIPFHDPALSASLQVVSALPCLKASSTASLQVVIQGEYSPV